MVIEMIIAIPIESNPRIIFVGDGNDNDNIICFCKGYYLVRTRHCQN